MSILYDFTILSIGSIIGISILFLITYVNDKKSRTGFFNDKTQKELT